MFTVVKKAIANGMFDDIPIKLFYVTVVLIVRSVVRYATTVTANLAYSLRETSKLRGQKCRS